MVNSTGEELLSIAVEVLLGRVGVSFNGYHLTQP